MGRRLRAGRLLEHDMMRRAFDRACSLEARERAIERLPCQSQFARNVLQLTTQVHRAAVGPGVEIEIEHHTLSRGADLDELDALPQLDDLTRDKGQEGHAACRIRAKRAERQPWGRREPAKARPPPHRNGRRRKTALLRRRTRLPAWYPESTCGRRASAAPGAGTPSR